MKKSLLMGSLLALISLNMLAQDQPIKRLPYYEIPEEPQEYTAGTVVSRMIDGLGFRYYWATDSLRTEDYLYKPNDEVRTTGETIDHIYGLSQMILNSAKKLANNKVSEKETLTYEQKRINTLNNFKEASDIFRQTKDLSEHKIIFTNSEYPFWNQINGPIADAIWHSGQIASFRRTSGNPFNSKVSVFSGKLRK